MTTAAHRRTPTATGSVELLPGLIQQRRDLNRRYLMSLKDSFSCWVGRLAALAVFGLPRIGAADSACGDAGHYLEGNGRVLLNNPDGRAFDIEVHRFQWWIGGGWDQPNLPVRVTAPDGTIALETKAIVDARGSRYRLPKGPAGVYRVDVTVNNLNFWYLSTTLDQSVVWTGTGVGNATDAPEPGWFLANPFVPRRWHFWVPAGTAEFRLVAQNNSGRSQREDHGLTLFSPRGQRMAVLWGQANPDDPLVRFGSVERRAQEARVLVEPGAAGRFWSIEVRFGDAHNYSDVNFALRGVPPYVARSPEEWFDGGTGKRAPVSPYDDAEFVQSHRSPSAQEALIQHWTPCPSFGDPDGGELLCPTRLAFWNPEGRPLQFCMATYLPRHTYRIDPQTNRQRQPTDAAYDQATLKIVQAGKTLLEDKVSLKSQHSHGPPYARTLDGAKGVVNADVAAAEHFWAYTYPATPAVLVGEPQADGSRRFRMEVASGRAWFFLVPKSTTAFTVRAAVAHEHDVLHMEVNAPDRTLDIIYGRSAEREIRVPPGLDGHIWHVRVDTGSASRLVPTEPKPRFPSLQLTFDLKGVPGYLSPTWEQWFEPEKPGMVWERP